MKYYLERITAILFLQTLFFKFTTASESVYILGLEPFGRIGAGLAELFTAVLLLFRKTSLFGAILGLVIISGAIASHVFFIGIEVLGDDGVLFGLAIVVFVLCLITVFIQKEKWFTILNRYRK